MTDIQGKSKQILDQYDDDGMLKSGSILILNATNQDLRCPVTIENDPKDIACLCDELLQEFHKFDEGLGLDGKWGGGSVTAVCRNWGNDKVRSSVFLFCLYRNVARVPNHNLSF